MSAPSPGWYQDPECEGWLRRWDGMGWTQQRRPSREMLDRLPPPPVSSALGRSHPARHALAPAAWAAGFGALGLGALLLAHALVAGVVFGAIALAVGGYAMRDARSFQAARPLAISGMILGSIALVVSVFLSLVIIEREGSVSAVIKAPALIEGASRLEGIESAQSKLDLAYQTARAEAALSDGRYETVTSETLARAEPQLGDVRATGAPPSSVLASPEQVERWLSEQTEEGHIYVVGPHPGASITFAYDPPGEAGAVVLIARDDRQPRYGITTADRRALEEADGVGE